MTLGSSAAIEVVTCRHRRCLRELGAVVLPLRPAREVRVPHGRLRERKQERQRHRKRKRDRERGRKRDQERGRKRDRERGRKRDRRRQGAPSNGGVRSPEALFGHVRRNMADHTVLTG